MPETSASMPKLLQIVCWLLMLTSTPLLAQRTCGTQKLDSIRHSRNPKLESKDAFERWMENQQLRKSSNARTQSTYTIPVVVHVVHNGSTSSQNIPDAQIISQINVLNKDFQRLNTDASQTPAEFQSVAGSLSVEFVLAKQDPDGNPTTGIVRINGGKSEWQQYQDSELKAKSYWPAERYLNIWVANIPEYLGYSTFPISNLSGIENSSEDRLTDGVVVHYQAIGSIDDGEFDLEPQFNKGRTLTHEIGHYFGLRHIWGDANSCAATDYVNDTPPQVGFTSGCPSHPQVQCTTNKMFQNYMDYSNDVCMNLFTAGQFGRVETVLQNSPRRASLLTSPGAQSPGNFVLDLGITAVTSPTELECSGNHTPTITIRNYGTNPITQASIRLSINGSTVQTITPTLSLNALQQAQVSFNPYNSNPGETRNFEITVLSVNGVTDEYPGNNAFTISTKTATESSLPFTETFEGSLNAWNILNPDNLFTWEKRTLSGSLGSVLYIDNYDYENAGTFDKIFSPVIDASSAEGLLLKFKLAHSHLSSVDGDALAVYATAGCSEDLSNAVQVFFKEGAALGTTTTNQHDFVPVANSWNTEYISLNDLIGTQNLRLAFVSRNGFGNNIYLDSIQVIGDAITDLALAEVIGPSWAVCTSEVTPQIKVLNQGSVAVNGFSIQIQRNGITIANQSFPYELAAGQSLDVSMSDITLTSAKTDLVFTVTPSTIPDDLTANNSIEWPITQITNTTLIPTRENFIDPSWTFVNAGSTNWGIESTNYQKSAVFRAFNAQNPTDKAWLVSPQLDFSKAFEASMFAEFSYAQNGDQDEHVLVMLSDNCGQSFDHVLLDATASELVSGQLNTEWTPASEDDWVRQYFNLNNHVGKTNILVAIQLTNDNGNNFYVDNIEFFENDDPTPPEVKIPFQVYSNETLTQTYLTFNLEEQQPAAVVVSNIMGASIANLTVDNALNQTLTFQLDAAPAIYIFRVLIGNKWHSVKQYIGN
jgi:hypothetical protein